MSASDSNNKANNQQLNAVNQDSIRDFTQSLDTFTSRLSRKMREKEEQEGATKRAREKRRQTMMRAMKSIRKALQEATRIELGDRFTLVLEIDDWEGWPRVQLNLVDSACPGNIDYGLIVTAHDRTDQGLINLALREGRVLDRLYMTDDRDVKRLPLVLKSTVRDFLDMVTQYILDPVDPSELLDEQTKAIEMSQEEIEAEKVAEHLLGEDLFTEEEQASNNNILNDQEQADTGAFASNVNLFKGQVQHKNSKHTPKTEDIDEAAVAPLFTKLSTGGVS